MEVLVCEPQNNYSGHVKSITTATHYEFRDCQGRCKDLDVCAVISNQDLGPIIFTFKSFRKYKFQQIHISSYKGQLVQIGSDKSFSGGKKDT